MLPESTAPDTNITLKLGAVESGNTVKGQVRCLIVTAAFHFRMCLPSTALPDAGAPDCNHCKMYCILKRNQLTK